MHNVVHRGALRSRVARPNLLRAFPSVRNGARAGARQGRSGHACGEGYGTAALALVARTAVGIDLDPDSVRHASARYMAMNVGFRAGDCTQIPAADASFDLVVSFETIEHLSEQSGCSASSSVFCARTGCW